MKYHTLIKAKAKQMREHPTPAEAIFAQRLRERGIHFRQQVVIGRYIADFVIPARMLIIELDGRQHFKPSVIRYDQRRKQYLEGCGFRMKRIQNFQAKSYDLHKLRNCKGSVGLVKLDAILKREQKATAKERAEEMEREEIKQMDRQHKNLVAKADLRPRLVKGHWLN